MLFVQYIYFSSIPCTNINLELLTTTSKCVVVERSCSDAGTFLWVPILHARNCLTSGVNGSAGFFLVAPFFSVAFGGCAVTLSPLGGRDVLIAPSGICLGALKTHPSSVGFTSL